jgi:thioredoxin reductase
MEKNVVVIGGGPAGTTAAISARRYYPNASIKLIRQEEKVLIPCG